MSRPCFACVPLLLLLALYLPISERFWHLKRWSEQRTAFPAEVPSGSVDSIPTRPAVSKSRLCPPHLSIDDWNASSNFTHFVLLSDAGGGGQFGNQLFTAGWSIMKALEFGWPLVVIPRTRQEKQRQVHKLPCLRSSQGAEEALARICGCNKPPNLWSDRNQSCNEGKGCRQFLQMKGILKEFSLGTPLRLNLRPWPPTTRQVLEVIFHAPVPILEPPVDLPGADDLVMHFRAYGQLFDEFRQHYRLQFPPFEFWKWTVEHHKAWRGNASQVWLVSKPGLRKYPTVLRLQRELGAQVFTRMDAMGKDAFLGDYSWLTKASALALSFSTLSWWAGFIGKATVIYMVLPPTQVPVEGWCKVLPERDPRYLFYDFYNGESFTDSKKATQRCEAFDQCFSKNKSCPDQGRNFLNLLKRSYPEVLANLPKNTPASQKLRMINKSLEGDMTKAAKGDQ